MDAILPDRKAAIRKGWRFQVQWIEQGKPCFHRCRTKWGAEYHAEQLTKSGVEPQIFDLQELLQFYKSGKGLSMPMPVANALQHFAAILANAEAQLINSNHTHISAFDLLLYLRGQLENYNTRLDDDDRKNKKSDQQPKAPLLKLEAPAKKKTTAKRKK